MFPPVQEYVKAPEISSTMTVKFVDMVDEVREVSTLPEGLT